MIGISIGIFHNAGVGAAAGGGGGENAGTPIGLLLVLTYAE